MAVVRVICSVGGSGSTFLSHALSKKYRVCRKPDAIFRTSFELGRDRDDTGFAQRHLISRGAGFTSSNVSDPAEFASDLSNFLVGNAGHIAILNTLHELGLLVKFRENEIAFLIRDPWMAYLSFFKPERHGRVAELLGGMHSRAAQLFFTRKWNALADEILHFEKKGRRPKIIRYETLDRDLIRLGLLDSVDGFVPIRGKKISHPKIYASFFEMIGERYKRVLKLSK